MTRRSDSPLYKRHYQFFTGCTDPNCYAWQNYGALGVTIYKPWASLKTGFDHFEHWVLSNLGPPPYPGAVLRRKDYRKGVMPKNLEWSTRKIVGNSRSSNLILKVNGRKQTLSQWATELGVNPRTVWSRINDHGYTPKQALGL